MSLVPFPTVDVEGMEPVKDDMEVVSRETMVETRFIKNLGQWESLIEYAGRTDFGSVGLGPDSIYFDIHLDEETAQVLKYSFIGSDAASITGALETGTISNYFIGNDPTRWASNVPSFEMVVYDDLWEGIDLIYGTSGSGLKYEFVLEPYADFSDILVHVEGAEELIVDTHKITSLLHDGSEFSDSGLDVFYGDGEKETIEAGFRSTGTGSFGFMLHDHDRSRPVVIDPFIMTSTVLGTSGGDNGGNFILDDQGNVYGVGYTSSGSFPTTAGVYDTTANGNDDLVVFKLDQTLSTLNFSTYIGGSSTDIGGSLALDANNSVYLTGTTFSNDFPTTPGAYDTTYQSSGSVWGESDGFVVKLTDNGTKMGFGTYLGVKMNESILQVVLDGSGNPIITGAVESSDFPTTSGAYDTTHNGGGNDIFITRLNSSGDKILYSTFLGGSGQDQCFALEYGSGDILYMTGLTRSSNFPTTSGAYDTVFNGGSSGYNSYALKFNMSGGTLDMSTFIGVSYGAGIKVDDLGNIHIVGQTTDSSFPTTQDAYDRSRNGQEDGTYSRLNPSGSRLLYSTFIGGSGWDSLLSIDLNSTGSPFMIGRSRSSDYPTTGGCYDSSNGGGFDIVVTRLDEKGSRLVYSTFMGGTGDDEGVRIYALTDDTAIIGVQTRFTSYPTTAGAYDTTHNGNYDIAFTEVDLTLVLLEPERPRNLTGSLAADRISLNWREPVNDGGAPILHYSIYRGLSPITMEVIDTTTELSYIDTGIDISQTYYYSVSATNPIGESLRTPNVKLWETVPPTFNGDLTPMDPAPGTEVVLNASFTDNVEVREARVEYWLGEGPHFNESMSNKTADEFWTYELELPDAVTVLHYRFSARDTKDNWVGTVEFTRTISGEVYPVLWNDRTPRIASPSTEFLFSIDVSDNLGVAEVRVEFWTDGGVHSSNQMANTPGTDTYTFITMVPNVIDNSIHYLFRARDIHNKWNGTMERIVPIMDNIPPWFLSDGSDTGAETGGSFDLMISVSDNLHVKGTEVEYWFDMGPTHMKEMIKGIGDLWSLSVKVPENAVSMNYRFHAMDPAGNWNSTGVMAVPVADTMQPFLINDSSSGSAFSGSPFTFRVEVGDNIGIGSGAVEYWFNEEDGITETLENAGPYLTSSILVPADEDGTLTYQIAIKDTSGNYLEMDEVQVDIIDNIGPTIDPIEDITRYAGENISITANAADNKGVKSISWNGAPFSSNTLTMEGTLDNPGVFDVTVTVRDPSGNSASTIFTITVLSSDNDGDMDGIPDLVEISLGLDKDDPFDGVGDMDSDGLPNWFEYRLGTLIDDPDSDGDGMPDGWNSETVFNISYSHQRTTRTGTDIRTSRNIPAGPLR